MRRTTPALASFVIALTAACQTEEAPPPVDRTAARADTVAMAAAAFDAEVFDTIVWTTPGEATDRGALVFRISCSKCHGEGGAGDGLFVFQGDTLHPPSFLGADWRFADDPEGLRRQIFSGSAVGMPYWGLVGLKYRDVDAVARYIQGPLRRSDGGA
ncbi:MAG: cytochrome c [Longimicrobiales bacterium]